MLLGRRSWPKAGHHARTPAATAVHKVWSQAEAEACRVAGPQAVAQESDGSQRNSVGSVDAAFSAELVESNNSLRPRPSSANSLYSLISAFPATPAAEATARAVTASVHQAAANLETVASLTQVSGPHRSVLGRHFLKVALSSPGGPSSPGDKRGPRTAPRDAPDTDTPGNARRTGPPSSQNKQMRVLPAIGAL